MANEAELQAALTAAGVSDAQEGGQEGQGNPNQVGQIPGQEISGETGQPIAREGFTEAQAKAGFQNGETGKSLPGGESPANPAQAASQEGGEGNGGDAGGPGGGEQPTAETQVGEENGRTSKAWGKLLARERRLYQQQKQIAETQKQFEERQRAYEEEVKLRQEDPVAWGMKHLPQDFFERYSQKLLDQQGTPVQEDPNLRAIREEVESLRREREEERTARQQAEQQANQQRAANEYLGKVREIAKQDDYRIASAWPGFENEVSNLVVQWNRAYGEMLTPQQAVDKVSSKVREHWARLREIDAPSRGKTNGAGSPPTTITNNAATATNDQPSDLSWDDQVALAAKNLSRGL